jgi:hypothetical protein
MLKKNTSSQIVQQMTLITEADNSSSTLDMGETREKPDENIVPF